jgi:hypothetical protein
MRRTYYSKISNRIMLNRSDLQFRNVERRYVFVQPVSPFSTWSLDCHTIALEASVPSKCDPQFDCYLSKI